MELVLQPRDSNLCGQACVAMLAGVSLERAIELVGTRGKTTFKRLQTALERLGFEVDYKARQWWRVAGWWRTAPGLFLGRVHYSHTKATHWVVVEGGQVFDPSGVDWTVPGVDGWATIKTAYRVYRPRAAGRTEEDELQAARLELVNLLVAWDRFLREALPCCESVACWGDENGGPHCSCWVPTYSELQQELDTSLRPQVRASPCESCACRVPGGQLRDGSPIPDDLPGAYDAMLDNLARRKPFYCHSGMRLIVAEFHPQLGVTREVDWHPVPPTVEGIPYKADGTPCDFCAAWAAQIPEGDRPSLGLPARNRDGRLRS